MIFRHGAAAVGFQQLQQFLHLRLQTLTGIGLGHLHALIHLFDDHGIACHVVIFRNGDPLAGEGPVRHDPHIPGGEDQGVAISPEKMRIMKQY